MLDVCFSDSAKGILKVAQKESSTFLKDSTEIISFYGLDMFDIENGVISETRKKEVLSFLKSPFEDDNSLNKWWNRQISDYNTLIKYIKKGKKIRIWYSNNPSSTCGLYFVLSKIKDFNGEVSIIKLPNIITDKMDNFIKGLGWGAIHPEEIDKYLSLERKLPKGEIQLLANKWNILKKENSKLRGVINGSLASVDINFYDSFIKRQLPNDKIKVGSLIGNVLGIYQLGISDSIVHLRIEEMIKNNEIKVVKDNNNPYKRIIIKNNN